VIPDMASEPLPLIQAPDVRLETPCLLVEDVAAIRPLIDRMFVTMYQKGGIGLAANQVGLTHRLFVMDVSPKSAPMVFINPEILDFEGETSIPEGCLSFPGETLKVQRAFRIRIRALDENGKPFADWVSGLLAICFQHELDHLDGITFEKRAKMQGSL